MKFSINSLLLWPKNTKFGYRRVKFQPNKVNIITGASKTGKSAIIPIIDYCLGAGECTIPVGVIRESCYWFGILIDLDHEQILICRKEPGSQKSTGAMYMSRGNTVEIPEKIDESNITLEQVKNILNELFSISFISTESIAFDGFSARPSYRDLMAFVFQPQNVITNNRTLFYNLEKLEHKNRLVNIFPYILGAVNSETLFNMQERDRLKKERDKLTRELNNIKNVSEKWKQEVQTWLSISRELGLTDYDFGAVDDFNVYVNELKRIAQKDESESNITANNVFGMSDNLVKLKEEERQLSYELSVAQKRFEAMADLNHSKQLYRQSLKIKRDRLNISSWLRTLPINDTCPICGEVFTVPNKELDELCDAIASIEKEANEIEGVSVAFDRELSIVKEEIECITEKLKCLRKRISEESARTQHISQEKYTLAGVSRFLGRLEFAIQTYENMGTDSELKTRLSQLDDRIDELEELISQNARTQKEKNALSFIENQANYIIKQLDVESPDDPITFDKTNLTIKIKRTAGREDYLWEIGSASNWLSYHISICLAFQKFFQERNGVEVPNFLVLDQPSQVYFPRKGIKEGSTAIEDAKLIEDEDKSAVKKVFVALNNYLKNAKSDFQIIVMEHADEDIWGDCDNTILIERWRGDEKLIPLEWIHS